MRRGGSGLKLESSLGRSIMGLLLIAAIFIAGNALLYGAQELYHYKDNQKLSVMKNEINNEGAGLDELEEQLNSMQKEISESEGQMQFWEENNMAREYNSHLDRHNSLINEYNEALVKYDEDLATYNIKIDDYNKLSQETGKRWYFVPIPRGKH